MATIFDGRFTGTFPNYTGWTSDPSSRSGYNVYWTITQLAGQAPSGLDAIRHDDIAQSAGTDGETSAWWTKDSVAEPTQGVAWYIKYRIKLNGAQSWVLALDSTGGISKSVVLGDNGASNGDRIMIHLRAPTATPTAINIAGGKNTGGISTTDGTGFVNIPTEDVWHSVQLAVQSSSTDSATDGWLKLYLDNDNVNAPNAASLTNLTLPVIHWNSTIRFGLGTMRAILTGHNQSVILADFMIDDAFDSTWYSSMTPVTSKGTSPVHMVGVF